MKFLNIKNCTVVNVSEIADGKGLKLETKDLGDTRNEFEDTMFITVWDSEKTPIKDFKRLFETLKEGKTVINLNCLFKIRTVISKKAIDVKTKEPWEYKGYDLKLISWSPTPSTKL